MKNRILLASGAALALIVVGLLLVPALVDVNRYRGRIEARLTEQLGREVALGDMDLGLLPPRFEVSETSVAEAPGFGDRPDFIRTERLAVRIGLLSLLSGTIDIRSLDLERPAIELVRRSDGVWNFSTLAARGTSDDAATSGAGEAAPAFALGRLSILDGQIALSDSARGTRTVYDHVDVTLRDYVPGQPSSFEIAAHLPGEGSQLLGLSGTGGPLDRDSPLNTPFDGTLTLDEVGIDGLRSFLGTDLLSSSNGSLSGTARLLNDGSGIDADGSLIFGNVRFNGIDVGYPIGLDYQVQADPANGLYRIDEATLALGNTPVSVSGSLDAASLPATLDLHLRASDVSIGEIARLAAAFGMAFPPEAQVAGNLDLDVEATGPAAEPVFDGTIRGRDLVVSGSRVRQPVEVDTLSLALSPDEIHSNEFGIRSGTTRATAGFALSDYASETPSVDAYLRAPGATLSDIQSIASAYGFTALERIEGAGALDVDLRAAGPLDSEADSADMMRALDGNIILDFSPLTLLGVDVVSQLGTIGGFDLGGTDNLTELGRLHGVIHITDGIAQTDDLQAELSIGSIAAAGSADLATGMLDLALSAVLSQATSESVGGTNVAGYLRTALTNSQGELALPLRVGGTLEAPRFAPDTRALGQMQARRLLPTLEDPDALLDALTGRGGEADADDGGDEPAAGADEPASEPEEVIRGILGGILGGDR